MQRRTTTQKLHEAISNNLLHIKKAECSYKSSNRIDEISKEEFKDNLDFLVESSVFSTFVDWNYGQNQSEKGEYVFETGAMNRYTENVITVYLCVGEDASAEDVERTLLEVEEE